MKRSAFRILCPCAGRRRARLRRCGGHISWPTSVASQTLPPVRVPWPYSITVQLVPESKFDLVSHGPRAVSVRAAETCADKSAGFASVSVAHWAQGPQRICADKTLFELLFLNSNLLEGNRYKNNHRRDRVLSGDFWVISPSFSPFPQELRRGRRGRRLRRGILRGRDGCICRSRGGSVSGRRRARR